MNFTNNQLDAITKSGTNIIVSAGAGSGKTAVLTERVTRKLDTTSINRLLILTFTNAAAAEMKDRIRKKLIERNLTKSLDEIDSSYITTFDSFALSIVKKYHARLGIPNTIGIKILFNLKVFSLLYFLYTLLKIGIKIIIVIKIIINVLEFI